MLVCLTASECFASDKKDPAADCPGGVCQPMEPPGVSGHVTIFAAGPFPTISPSHARWGTAVDPPGRKRPRCKLSASGSDDAGSDEPSSAERRRPELEVSAAAAGTFQRRRFCQEPAHVLELLRALSCRAGRVPPRCPASCSWRHQTKQSRPPTRPGHCKPSLPQNSLKIGDRSLKECERIGVCVKASANRRRNRQIVIKRGERESRRRGRRRRNCDCG